MANNYLDFRVILSKHDELIAYTSFFDNYALNFFK